MEHLIHVFSGVMAALAHHKAATFLPGEVAFGIAGVTALCFAYVANVALRAAEHSRVFDWRFRAVGMWIEAVNHHEGSQYAMSLVTYSRRKGEFEITGHTFSKGDLEVYSSWRSLALSFPEKDCLYYIYSLKNFKSPHGDVIGFAQMTFFATPGIGRPFFDGKGYFLDKNSEAKEVHYTFERLDRKLIKQTIGKTSIDNAEDRRNFLREYARREPSSPPDPRRRKGARHRGDDKSRSGQESKER
jgi:hypothetical protein